MAEFVVPEAGAYAPTEEDLRGVEEWFARYDALSAEADVEGMADMAVFPLNLVSDDSKGDAWTGQWSRAEFVRTMREVMGGDEDVSFESVRTPHFLSASLAVVFTDAVFTVDGRSQAVRYADVLVKRDGVWAFQTMIQGGWGDLLRR
ncbi:nuclear transport factor 2 family protein [Streptomyces sp. NPDC053542]|uniref:nuclear transport factor 2 family protein n=1 Tax=Streptomyces sp. NPDC053542 TaxID=3365710 RepID=UPI0037CFD08B